MKPTISVIVPVYQVEPYIENCVKSLCDQTFNNYEIIFVNDGTKDNSIKIAEDILSKTTIPYSIINQQNKGLSAARNTGIANAKGEWIICVDSDDIVNSLFLETLYEPVEKQDTKVSIVNYQTVSLESSFFWPLNYYDYKCLKNERVLDLFLRRKINIVVTAILIHKELINGCQIWFDEKIRFSEDQHFIWRILLASSNDVIYNQTKLYNYLHRENSIMTSSSIEKILTGYNGFLRFTQELKEEKKDDFADLLMARWVFGALHSASKIMEYEDYDNLAHLMDYKRYLKRLVFFPDIRVRGLALIMASNLQLFYGISKKI